MRAFLLLTMAFMLLGCQPGQAQNDPYNSGGLLMPEQAAYDVTFYDLDLRVNPADSTIGGTLTATVRIASPLAWFVLDLDPLLDVEQVQQVQADGSEEELVFERRSGKIWAAFPYTKQPGEEVTVAVTYGGHPRMAPNPPWEGGFTWARTPSGDPWIATTCQTIGADVWWPVKDHVSDEPDSMALHITVPDPLVVATNGRLQEVAAHDNGTSTYHWLISTPINVYNVALNIAPYRTIEDEMESVAGGTFPVVFYVLPEDYEKGQALFPEILDQVAFFEETIGPYPFRADKYGVAQTPHLGMEHQTIIAYGANFDNGAMTGGVDWGFDALHQHELAHEWWGNLVTNADWSDMWLHEGIGSYMQPLYREHLMDEAAYHEYMASMRGGIGNRKAVAPRGTLSSKEIYDGHDIYSKGAWVVHTLRYLIGEDAVRTVLRRMAYPDPDLAQVAEDCPACRFATTDDLLHIAEDVAGRDLDWFFEVYLRQPDLPRIETRREGSTLALNWEVPDNLPFPMPVDVMVNGEMQRVDMPNGAATITIPEDATLEVDPHDWILREGN
ncbi:MAG TPA: M1 family metallopeptidase [Rhodothermales bacterium]|nr:M1 family metallopeptidase [Rhodothermales bacterium]